jgi:hypothetical protein
MDRFFSTHDNNSVSRMISGIAFLHCAGSLRLEAKKTKSGRCIRQEANTTSTQYGQFNGGMTMCLVRGLESQVIAYVITRTTAPTRPTYPILTLSSIGILNAEYPDQLIDELPSHLYCSLATETWMAFLCHYYASIFNSYMEEEDIKI